MGKKMNVRMLTHVRALWNSPYVPQEINRANQRKWIRSIRYLVKVGCLLNTLKGNQMHIDTDYILKSINDTSHILYRNPAEQADRLAWEVGALSSKIREMAALLQYKADQLEQLKKELQ